MDKKTRAKCIQKGDKKDLQKELLNSFEVLKTFRDYKGKIHVKKTFNETTINWDKNKDFLALTPSFLTKNFLISNYKEIRFSN